MILGTGHDETPTINEGNMNRKFNIEKTIVAMLLAAGLIACGKTAPTDTAGPAEMAGQKIDATAEKAGDKLGEAADKIGEQSDKAGVAIQDTEITAKVKAAIFAEHGLKTLQISVDTIQGVVTLTGSVNTLQNSDRARGLAAATAGVKSVDNRLVLK